MIYQQSALALGSNVDLTLNTDLSEKATNELFKVLWRKIYDFELNFSRFLPESELSVFNNNSGNIQTISQDFENLLRATKKMSELTGGIFNPFILPILQAVGYDHSFIEKYINDPQPNFTHKKVATIDQLILSPLRAFIPANSALDLGGIGKGYLADQLAVFIEDKLDNYWFSLGGDIIANGHDAQQQNWIVNIASYLKTNKEPIAQIMLPTSKRTAVASSGITKRKGIKQGIKWHHLIDPRTLKPANTDIQMSTVINSNCLEADVFASCLVILGSKHYKEFVNQHKIKNYLLQIKNKNHNPLIVHTGSHIKLL